MTKRITYITRELLGIVCPEHGRTSCSDENPNNGTGVIEETKLKGVVISRDWGIHPRCNRCYLLDLINHQNGVVDPRVVVEIDVTLGLEQPDFDIKQK